MLFSASAFVFVVIFVFIMLLLAAGAITKIGGIDSDYEIRQSLKQLAKRFDGQLLQKTKKFPEVLIISDGTPFTVSVRDTKKSGAKYICRVRAPWEDVGFRLKIVRETYATATQDMLKALDAKTGDAKFDKQFYLRTNNEAKMRQFLNDTGRANIQRLFRIGCGQVYINNDELFAERGIQSSFVSASFVKQFVELTASLAQTPSGQIQILSTSHQSTDPPTCQVCGDDMVEQLVACLSCKTLHHRDCWNFVGFCSTYACGEKICQGLDEPN